MSVRSLVVVLLVAGLTSGCDVFTSGEDPLPVRQTAWDRTDGPYGGEIVDVAIAPEGTAFAATYGYGLYRRANGAEAWSRIPFDDNYFHSVYAAPNGHVLTANDARGVLRSTDGGETWDAAGTGLENTPASREGCRLYDLYTGAHRRVHAFMQAPSAAYFAATDCGLYRAGPSVEAWTYVGLRAYDLRSIVVHPNGTLLAGSRSDGLFVSNDDGSTWTQQTFDGEAETSIISGLAVDETGRVYAGTNVLHVSTDAGATWETASGTGDRFGYPEIVARAEGVYVASLNGLLYSNEGAAWTVIDALPETGVREYGAVQGLAFYPDGTALVHQVNAGITRSEGGVQRWVRYNAGIQGVDVRSVVSSSDGTLYTLALQPDIAHRSLDDGRTWMPIDGLANASVDEIFADADGVVYAASTFRLYRSTDRGVTWSAHNLEAGDLSYGLSRGSTQYRLAVTVTPEGDVLAGAGPGGVYRSEDGGASWTSVLASLRAADIAATSEAAFVISTEGVVHRSGDDGTTWSRLTDAPLPNAADAVPQRMETIPGGGVLVTTTSGLYRLSPGGTWTELGFAGRYVAATFALDKRTFLAATYSDAAGGDQVFLSTDNGATWSNISGGFEALTLDVHDFTQGPFGTVYMATRGAGVYRGIGPLAL